jgi:hypothetical protein
MIMNASQIRIAQNVDAVAHHRAWYGSHLGIEIRDHVSSLFFFITDNIFYEQHHFKAYSNQKKWTSWL